MSFVEMMPQEMFAAQRQFIKAMGANRDFVWWAKTLIVEETKELNQAHQTNEGMAQIFKESADVFYVVAGFYNTMSPFAPELLSEEDNEELNKIIIDAWTALATVSQAYNIPMFLFGQAFSIVHASNMSKLGEDGKPIRREDGKIMKGPNYIPPDMTPVVQAYDEFIAQNPSGEGN